MFESNGRAAWASVNWLATTHHLDLCHSHRSTPRRYSSHPRGFRLFTCQRAQLSYYATNTCEFVAFHFFPHPTGRRERNNTVASAPVNGVLRISSRRLAGISADKNAIDRQTPTSA